MTEIEKVHIIRRALMAAMGGFIVYRGGKHETALVRADAPGKRDNVYAMIDSVVESLKNEKVLPHMLTLPKLAELGSHHYEVAGPDINFVMLLPLWLHPFVHDDAPVTDIYGTHGTFKDAKHTVDAMHGCLPYGVPYQGAASQYRLDFASVPVLQGIMPPGQEE